MLISIPGNILRLALVAFSILLPPSRASVQAAPAASETLVVCKTPLSQPFREGHAHTERCGVRQGYEIKVAAPNACIPSLNHTVNTIVRAYIAELDARLGTGGFTHNPIERRLTQILNFNPDARHDSLRLFFNDIQFYTAALMKYDLPVSEYVVFTPGKHIDNVWSATITRELSVPTSELGARSCANVQHLLSQLATNTKDDSAATITMIAYIDALNLPCQATQ